MLPSSAPRLPIVAPIPSVPGLAVWARVRAARFGGFVVELATACPSVGLAATACPLLGHYLPPSACRSRSAARVAAAALARSTAARLG